MQVLQVLCVAIIAAGIALTTGCVAFDNVDPCLDFLMTYNSLECVVEEIELDANNACPGSLNDYGTELSTWFNCLGRAFSCEGGILQFSNDLCVFPIARAFPVPLGAPPGTDCRFDLLCPVSLAVGESVEIGEDFDALRNELSDCFWHGVPPAMLQDARSIRWTAVGHGGEAAFLQPHTGTPQGSVRGSTQVELLGVQPGYVGVYVFNDDNLVAVCGTAVVPAGEPCDSVECPPGEVCNPASGVCELEPECSDAPGCDDQDLCTTDACVDGVCENDAKCAAGETCDPAVGVCEPDEPAPCGPAGCPPEEVCASDDVCRVPCAPRGGGCPDGTFCAGDKVCRIPCEIPEHCPDGEVCLGFCFRP